MLIFNVVTKSANILLLLFLFLRMHAFAQAHESEVPRQRVMNLTPEQQIAWYEEAIENSKFDNRSKCLVLGKEAYHYGNQQQDVLFNAKGNELLGYAYLLNFQYDSALFYLKRGLRILRAQPKECIKLNMYAGDAFWYNGQFDSSRVYYQNGQRAARDVKNLPMLATLTINIADYYRQVGNFNDALTTYQQGIEYAQQDTSHIYLPKAYNNIALLYAYIGDTYTELDYYFKAVDASNKPILKRSQGLFYANIAEVYASLGDFEKSKEYIEKGISLSKEHHQLRALMNSYEMLGKLYLNMDSLRKAKNAFMESIRLNEELKDKRYVARNLGHLGTIECRLGNYKQAALYFEEGINTQEDIDDKKFKIKNLQGLSLALLYMGKLPEAFRKNDEALKLAETLGIPPAIAESYAIRSDILGRQGELKKALFFQKKYDSITSQIEKQDRIRYIHNLEKLQLAKVKEMENLTLKKDMELQATVIDRQKKTVFIGIITIIALAVVTFIIFALFRKNQKAKRLISLQNASLLAKHEEIQSMNEQQENLLHLVVHDLRSPLNKIEGLVSILRLEGGLTPGQLDLIRLIENVTKKNKMFISEFLETSQMQYRSRQPKKEAINLMLLLEEIKEEYTPQASKKEINILYKLNIPDKPAYCDRGLLYHIIINLLSNAIKYSPAQTQIDFHVWAEGEALCVLIKDQGQGFSEHDKQSLFKKFQKLSAQPIGSDSSTGLGLFLTKILVDSLNGKITLESEEKKGSSFLVKLEGVFI